MTGIFPIFLNRFRVDAANGRDGCCIGSLKHTRMNASPFALARTMLTRMLVLGRTGSQSIGVIE